MGSSPRIVSIELNVEVGSDPIAGELRGQCLQARRFVGWVALVRTLEEAVSAAAKTGEAR